MELQLQRIHHFLKSNTNRCFHTSDIAFHLRMDEIRTENALHYLFSNNMVTTSHDSCGNVVWFIDGNSVKQNQVNNTTSFRMSGNTSSGNKTSALHITPPISDRKEKAAEKFRNKMHLWIFIAIAAIIASGIFSCAIWVKSYIDHKFSAAVDIARSAVPMKEYFEFTRQSLLRDAALQRKVDVLHMQIDSVSGKIDSLNKTTQAIQHQTNDIRKILKRR